MNQNEKTRVTVEIFGTKYNLLADSSSASYVTMVGAHVNEQMHKLAKQHPRLDISRLAVLAAINIANELMKTREQLDLEHAVSVEKKNQELSSLQEKYAEALNELDKVNADYKKLQVELENVREQLRERMQEQTVQEAAAAQKGTSGPSANNHDTAIYEEYEKLKEEYKKLQQEFNEWIELTEEELDQDA